MARSCKPQLNAPVLERFGIEPARDAEIAEQLDRALLKHSRTDPSLYVITRMRLQNNRLYTGVVKDASKCEPGRPRSYDADLSTHTLISKTYRSCTAKT